MYERWTKEQEEIFFRYCKIKSIDELSNLLGKTREQVKTKAWRNNIILMNVWSYNEDEYLKNNYLSKTYAEIAIALNRTKSAIQGRCRKLGLIKSYRSLKKDLDSNYFEAINTEEKAYWLGFIRADGCVSYNKNSNAYSFKITLQKGDSDVLYKFIKSINGKFEPKFKTAKIADLDKIYETCEVCFKDKKFTYDLLKHFQVNKTESLRIPENIPKHLLRHFIRGFSDGNGCFYVNLEKRDKSYEIVGKSMEMLRDIQMVFAHNNIQSTIYKKRKTNYKLFIGSLKELIKLQSYLYDGATIFMERKYIKSQSILKLAP